MRIGSKGRITLPKDLRDKYHLKAREKVIILDAEDGIVVRHSRTCLRGILKGKVDSEGFEKDLRELRKQWSA